MSEKSRELFELEQIVCGSLLESELPSACFDVVTFWDVIEHLEEPIPHLEAAHRLLKDDGLLVIETQNVESRFARLMGRKWQHYKMAAMQALITHRGDAAENIGKASGFLDHI